VQGLILVKSGLSVTSCSSVNSTRIKICGLTSLDDALVAEAAGADAIGFVFVGKSVRCTSVQDARHIANGLGPFIQRVGLFLDPSAEEVDQALQAIPEMLPQFHGRESADFCESFGCHYLKAIGLADGLPDFESLAAYSRCSGFLFDSNAPGQLGGTGHTFDWQMLSDAFKQRLQHRSQIQSSEPGQNDMGDSLSASLILAGGLSVDNVADGIRTVRPYAVDVSSGVESAPGVKDSVLIKKFVLAVHNADNQLRVE